MPIRRKHRPVAWLIDQIDQNLRRFGADQERLSLREKVLRLVEIQREFRDLSFSVLYDSGLAANAAMERIRLYLLQNEGQVIEGAEIEIVAGISEYARRVRQLRVEDGYQIASGATPDPESGIDLKPDQYLLVTKEPDREAAYRWKIANRIRKKKGSATERLLEFLQANVGKAVTTDELAYVAKDVRSFARRVRELRTEEGYAVATRFTGRPDLRSGQYVLESGDRIAEPHDRHIPDEVQKQVYARDSNKCRICGWAREDWTRQDPRYLELHHVQHHQHRGPNVRENLIVICSRCHDDLHAGRINAPKPE